MENKDIQFMKVALSLASEAFEIGEIPVGALVVDSNGEIISSAYNLRETKKNATAHAEILAIEQACAALGSWRLKGCTLYVTLEPCPMCAGALVNSRIDRVVFDATDYSGDESHQCRVVYDIINNQFMLKNNSYVEFNGWIY